MFRPSRGPGSTRFLYARVASFFLGAGIWIGAVIADRPQFTGLAIGVLFVGLILGLVGRRREPD
jgi:hypothetical protein